MMTGERAGRGRSEGLGHRTPEWEGVQAWTTVPGPLALRGSCGVAGKGPALEPGKAKRTSFLWLCRGRPEQGPPGTLTLRFPM